MPESTLTIIFVVVLIVTVALVLFNYHHNKHLRYNIEELKSYLNDVMTEKGNRMLKTDVLRLIQRKYNCSWKVALYLLGQAREHYIVDFDQQEVKLL